MTKVHHLVLALALLLLPAGLHAQNLATGTIGGVVRTSRERCCPA